MITAQELSRKIKDLPPLPDIVVRLLRASRDPNTPIREMVELISYDPALTAKVLRLCNSAYYGMPRHITSIQEALVYLGTDTLVNFVLAGCLSTFYQQAHEGYGLAAGELWRHSIGCAIAARHLARTESSGAQGEAFTAGLLHDVGKIILNSYVASSLEEIAARVEERKITLDEAEREVLGFSHADAGAELARAWNLPPSLIEAIAFHLNPTRAENHPRIVAIVHLANILCHSFGIGIGNDSQAYAFHPVALKIMGIEVTDLSRISQDVHGEFRKAEELVGIIAEAA